MHESKNDAPASKVIYSPIEASIRWAGLLRYEQVILASISSPRKLPKSLDCPRWDELRLFTERIYDGILNRELPFGQNGVTLHDMALIDSPNLTVRHIELKRWMREHYPEQRPGFLFSRSERISHPCITLETGQAMLVERLAMKSALEQYKRQLHELQDKHNTLLKQSTVIPACAQHPISDRAEATYLHIVGTMLELMLSRSPSGIPYSSFNSQEAIATAMIAHHGELMGITDRTLQAKFAQARRKLRSAVS